MLQPKVQKVTTAELSQALQDVIKNDDQMSFLSKPSYDEILDTWIDSFQEDPLAVWLMNFGDDVRKFDTTQRKLMTDFEKSFLSWPARPVILRRKGLTIGLTTPNGTNNDDPTKEESTKKQLAGAMAVVPSAVRVNTFWDIVTNMYHIGPPPMLHGKTKKLYGQHSSKRFSSLKSLDNRKAVIMKGERKRYIYLFVLGVRMSHHGQGLGGKLMRTVVQAADSLNAYLYLETESAENESFYQHYGFYTHETQDFKAKGDTSDNATYRMYLMVRNPNGVPPNDKN